MDAGVLLQAVLTGLSSGAVLGLVALGFTLVAGTVRVLQLAHGDVVVASVLAAGRDPRRRGADLFDPRRSPALPHTAFGHGAHRCLGAPLARLEGRIALDRLLTRCPDLRLATAPDQLVLRPSLLMHGPTSLPVALCAPA